MDKVSLVKWEVFLPEELGSIVVGVVVEDGPYAGNPYYVAVRTGADGWAYTRGTMVNAGHSEYYLSNNELAEFILEHSPFDWKVIPRDAADN